MDKDEKHSPPEGQQSDKTDESPGTIFDVVLCVGASQILLDGIWPLAIYESVYLRSDDIALLADGLIPASF